jgi:hypothetical protein
MNDSKTNVRRRTFIRLAGSAAVAVPFLGLAGRTAVAQDKLDTNDPMAKTLEYTMTSTKADQTCANCALYQGGDAEFGACPLFAGKLVAAKGWCKSWVKKA